MTLGELLVTPEAHYVGLPVAASLLAFIFGAVSRPRGHRLRKGDFQLGLGWNLSAIIIFCSETAVAAKNSTQVKAPYWTGWVLLALLGVTAFYVLEYGWVREPPPAGKKIGTIKEPLETHRVFLPIILGAMSLLVLHITMR